MSNETTKDYISTLNGLVETCKDGEEGFRNAAELSAYCPVKAISREGVTAFTTCASAGAFWQLRQNDDLDEATGGAYAMADSAIEANTLQ